jgi:hypothetical protein
MNTDHTILTHLSGVSACDSRNICKHLRLINPSRFQMQLWTGPCTKSNEVLAILDPGDSEQYLRTCGIGKAEIREKVTHS